MQINQINYHRVINVANDYQTFISYKFVAVREVNSQSHTVQRQWKKLIGKSSQENVVPKTVLPVLIASLSHLEVKKKYARLRVYLRW